MKKFHFPQLNAKFNSGRGKCNPQNTGDETFKKL